MRGNKDGFCYSHIEDIPELVEERREKGNKAASVRWSKDQWEKNHTFNGILISQEQLDQIPDSAVVFADWPHLRPWQWEQRDMTQREYIKCQMVLMRQERERDIEREIKDQEERVRRQEYFKNKIVEYASNGLTGGSCKITIDGKVMVDFICPTTGQRLADLEEAIGYEEYFHDIDPAEDPPPQWSIPSWRRTRRLYIGGQEVEVIEERTDHGSMDYKCQCGETHHLYMIILPHRQGVVL